MTGREVSGSRKSRVLVVDDDRLSREMMVDILVPLGYEVMGADNGVECLEMVRRHLPDLVFLDVVMPVMDGFTACEALKSDSRTRHIPVVLVTSLGDRESKLRGLSVGANDFLSKPADGSEISIRAKNLLRVKEFEDFLRRHNEELDVQVKERTRQLSDALDELRQSKEELRKSYLDTIFKLTVVAEYKDGFTSDHIKKVGHYCRILARKIGWTEKLQDKIFYSSPMHDIGKVSIPADILLKPGRLTTEEYALMKTHTRTGARILEGSSSEYLSLAEQIAMTHHERWDGSGYPQGLKEEAIPMAGRIMNVADQYDALRTERPYKPALGHDEVFRIITEGDGRTMPSHFDPVVLEAFKDSSREFQEIYRKFCS